ncbi:hypothetical protein LSH36_491g00039 [Paralvinella palmiformis]|uniref:Protein kinase domain-containing protein n=1 Tax=Paralvinella palmiformis TaxID=53620 RepID=A0AAD9MY69_9ANNE|nr:hypothetical protein LSH36_491g00039 [Paralvinella palmiformis]
MTELRLHKVEQESDLIMKRLDRLLDQNVNNVAQHLSDFLRSQESREKMMLWSMDDLPRVLDGDLWVDVASDIDCVIERKLAEILRDWDGQYKLFQKVQTSLLTGFKEEFLVLESQLSSIEHCIQSDDISLSEKSDEDTTRFLGLTDNVNTTESIFDFNLSTFQKIMLGFAAPVLVPVAMGLLVGAPIFLLWDFKKWRRQSIAQKNLDTYLEDPISFLKARSKNILDKVAEVANVKEYVAQQMEPARLVLDAMRCAIPNLVESNRKLMEDIVNDKRTGKELQERYLEYETWIPVLQEKLARYGNVHIREYDFRREDVELLSEEGGVFSKWHRTVGIWTDIRPGKLTIDGKNHVVSIKSYRKRVSALHMFTEEAHLRRTRHPNVAIFLGTYQKDKGIPGILLQGKLTKARQELFGFRALPKASRGRHVLMERCRKILEQVGMGLEYLHFRGLVHMEVSLDTIMIERNKEMVKLTNLGESRKADFPDNLDSETSEFCYLSPEVLRGDLYKARSDMYSLGLVAWELWNQEMAFVQQRKAPLRQFIQTVHPDLLQYDDNNPFLGLIKRCLTVEVDERICSTTWVNEVRKLDILVKDDDSN